MNVSTLIERLRELPPEAPVVFPCDHDQAGDVPIDAAEIYRWPDGSMQVELSR